MSHATFIAAIGAVALIRWRLLRDTPDPAGLDGGNWLAFGHAIFGEHIRSSTLAYPPVVPLAAVVFEHLLGPYSGLRFLSFVASAAPPLGMYILLYAWGMQWRAAILAGFMASSAGTGEAMLWGGYPQLIGLGILPLFILALDWFLLSSALWRALPAAVLLAAALATSDLIGPLTAIVGVLYLTGRYAYLRIGRRGNSTRNVLVGIVLSVVLALPLVPLYAGLLPGVAHNEQVVLLGGSPLTSALKAFNGVAQDSPNLWLVSLVAALGSPLVLILQSGSRPSILSSAVLFPTLALLIVAHQNRIAYLLPVGIVAGLAAWWGAAERAPAWGRNSVNAAVVASLVIGILGGILPFAGQRDYYTVLNPGVAQGLARLDALSAPRDLIAVSPAPQEWPLGWWVEGVGRRPSVYAGSPLWLNYADEKARNAIANRIFAATGGVEASRQEARKAGARYLFVDKQWSDYVSWIQSGPPTDPSAVVFENDSVVIIAAGD